MANYYCSSRTNYFRVKDVAAFKAWAGKRGVEVYAKADRADCFCVLPGGSTDSGGFPSWDEDKEDDFDFIEELARHLDEKSVAVIVEAGAEKLRYITAFAVAITATGKRVEVSLADIYGLAAKAFPGKEVTRAEY